MMTTTELTKAWKTVIAVYQETLHSSPKQTADAIIDRLGCSETLEVFATVTQIKANDCRISSQNRRKMAAIPVNLEAISWESGNKFIHAGLDEIHTAHIDQIITELVK